MHAPVNLSARVYVICMCLHISAHAYTQQHPRMGARPLAGLPEQVVAQEGKAGAVSKDEPATQAKTDSNLRGFRMQPWKGPLIQLSDNIPIYPHSAHTYVAPHKAHASNAVRGPSYSPSSNQWPEPRMIGSVNPRVCVRTK